MNVYLAIYFYISSLKFHFCNKNDFFLIFELRKMEMKCFPENSSLDDLTSEELKELLRLKDITLKEKEVKIEETEEIIKEILKANIPLKTLFKGYPKLKFLRVNKSETASNTKKPTIHKSKHDPIGQTLKMKIHVSDVKVEFDNIEDPFSTFFKEFEIRNTMTIQYTSEDDLKHHVHNFMNVILNMMDSTSFLKCYQTTSVISVSIKKDSKYLNVPDIIVIKTRQNLPVILLKIKSILEDGSILDDEKVIGQAYDYMVSFRSFYNRKVVYGILTNLKEWKFLKLSEDEVIDFSKREVYQTKIYNFHDKKLPRTLISVIKESLVLNTHPIQIFSTKRAYIEYKTNEWRWKMFNDKQLDNFVGKINLYSSKEEDSYTVFKYFPDGTETQTSLCISSNSSICIIKQYFGKDVKSFKKEAKMWKKIYEIDTGVIYLCNKPSLVMHLVFTCTQKEEEFYDEYIKYTKKKIWFELNLKKIFAPEGGFISYMSINLENLQSKIKSLYRRRTRFKNVLEVAEQAIKEFASKGYYHNDLEWRHVGIKPILENNEIIGFKPMLIDLEYVLKETPENAEKIMMERLSLIKKKCIFTHELDF